MRCFFRLLLLVFLANISGCASGLGPEADSLVSLMRGELNGRKDEKAFAALNPAYRYLRVELDGSAPVLMVLGYVDMTPDGAVEVWYSALGEVIKTIHGRIVSTTGLPVDWARVKYAKRPVGWGALGGSDFFYERQRDERPSYRVRHVERVEATFFSTRKASTLPFMLPSSLPEERAQRLFWFRERVSSPAASGLPDAWFALSGQAGKETLVFSRQCLSESFCLNLQAWPAREEAL
jgi:hypothetical protein